MKRISKIAIGGFLTLTLAVGGLEVKNWIKRGEAEVQIIRNDLPSRIILNNDFWNAENVEEAREIYFEIIADYAKELNYRRPGSAAWMPRKFTDIENKLIWKFYNSETLKKEFGKRTPEKRLELYDLLIKEGY